MRPTDPSSLPLVSYLRECLSYDPETGLLTRLRAGPANRRLEGKPAGYVNPKGYLQFRIGKASYLAHRVAWALHHGEWPTQVIDHVNGDRADNRIANLRLATKSENAANSPQRRARSGFKGVYFNKGKWRAVIVCNGRHESLGRFEDPETAGRAYDAAAVQRFGEFASLNFPNQEGQE